MTEAQRFFQDLNNCLNSNQDEGQFVQDYHEFRTFEPNITAVEALKTKGDGNILPMFDFESKTFTIPSEIHHFKFAAKRLFPLENDDYYKSFHTIMAYLRWVAKIPVDWFEGKCIPEKMGLWSWNNPHNTTVRYWSSRKVGQRYMFEVSVASYKDGRVQPMK